MTPVVTVTEDAGGALGAASTTADVTEVEGMNMSYGTLAHLAGLGLCRGMVPAGAEVPMHASPDAYAMYVVAGRGHLLLQAAEADPVVEQPFAPGTLITFPPGARHGWRVAPGAALEWFGVEIPAGSAGHSQPPSTTTA